MIQNKKSIILLSGGLDSVVSLALLRNEGINITNAIIFNYGQKSFEKEFKAAEKIAEFYGIKLDCIELDWLKNITNTALVSQASVPSVNIKNLDDKTLTTQSMKSVWVPNRNGLFIHIAAAFADSFNIDYIIIGANKEEAATFSDNSKEFIEDINKSLKTSTNKKVEVLAPLINLNKEEIVKKALELNVPLQYINSCYNNTPKHCGNCESCNRLKRALVIAKKQDLIEQLFD